MDLIKTFLEFNPADKFKNFVNEIIENSNIQLITKGKNDQEIIDLIDDLILDLKEQNNLKKMNLLKKN